MRVLLLIFCALLVSFSAEAHHRGVGRSHGSHSVRAASAHKVSSLTQCDVSEISEDIKSILQYTYTMVTDSVWDLVDIAGNLIFCANSMLSWLCGSDDWQARVEARWSQLQEAVTLFQQEVPTLWQQVVEEVESCF